MNLSRSVFSGSVVGALVITSVASAVDTPLTTQRVTAGLSSPVFLTSPPGDTTRLFVVQQGGRIRIIKYGTLLPDPFLIISVSFSGERGLLGMAFDPDFSHNKYFYVNYVRSLTTYVRRFKVSDADPAVADPDSELVSLTQSQPFSNHNAGMLAFGPLDGMLYIGFGDGGSANDPSNRAQNGQTWLGKMLRIDVSNARKGNTYEIPADNPFVGDEETLDEIWASGLRNPWRYTFDSANGDLYIGDVGQDAREEIDYRPGDSPGGENYGWRCLEGTRCTGLSGCSCADESLIDPVHEYPHAGRQAVVGGYVYRGFKIPDLQGTYFFADYESNHLGSMRVVDGQMVDLEDRTDELAPGGFEDIRSVSSYGEDANGELYILDRLDGEIYKIVPQRTAFPRDFVVNRGVLSGGKVEDLFASDDRRVSIQARRPTKIAANSVEIEVSAIVSTDVISALRYTLEAGASGSPASQNIEMFNYDTERWERMDQREAPSADTPLNVEIVDDPSRFIHPVTCEVKVRVGYLDLGVTFPSWGGRFDLMCWTVIP